VGEVLSTEQHPNADKLKVCQVNVGQAEPLANRLRRQQCASWLKNPGGFNWRGIARRFKIKESKLRGELSFGMLCSEKELGLAANSNGLMELPTDAPVGIDIRDYLTLNDNVIELGLTPNRADCLSVEGIAREVAVLNNLIVSAQTTSTSNAISISRYSWKFA
jgi:phenylalanyl-tRNA synthetase beta chain